MWTFVQLFCTNLVNYQRICGKLTNSANSESCIQIEGKKSNVALELGGSDSMLMYTKIRLAE